MNSENPFHDSFVLGGLTFHIERLDYSSHNRFMLALKPLLEALARKSAEREHPSNAATALTDAVYERLLLEFVQERLPEMVSITCNNARKQEPAITPEWVAVNAKSATELAWIAIKQIRKDDSVFELMDFVISSVPLGKAVKRAMEWAAQQN